MRRAVLDPGAVLEASWALLGISWALLGQSWRHLGRSWGGLGGLLGALGRSWGGLGGFLGALGRVFGALELQEPLGGRLGAVLEENGSDFGGHLGALFGILFEHKI